MKYLKLTNYFIVIIFICCNNQKIKKNEYCFSFYLPKKNGEFVFRNLAVAIIDTSVYKIEYKAAKKQNFSSLSYLNSNKITFKDSIYDSKMEYELFYQTKKPYIFDSIKIYRLDLKDTTKIKRIKEDLYWKYENNKFLNVIDEKQINIIQGFCSLFHFYSSHNHSNNWLIPKSYFRKTIFIEIHRNSNVIIYHLEPGWVDCFYDCFFAFT